MDLVDLPSALASVTVFSRGALCMRTARLSRGPSGALPSRVRVTGLPLSLRSGSLRARIASNSSLRVHDLRQSFDVRLRGEVDLAAEERALQAAEDVVRRLEREHRQVSQEIQQVTALRPAPLPPKEGDPPRPAPVDSMLALSRFVDEQLAALHRTRRDLEEKLIDARNELELRHRRLEEASTARRTGAAQVLRAAVISLDGPLDSTPEVDLELEYFVPGARWFPSYELRLDRSLERGALLMRASVAQRSGEDWSGVRLRLSTADLLRRAAVPELKALRIGRAQPPTVSHGWRPPPPGLDELFSDHDTALLRHAEEAAARPPPPAPANAGRAVAKGGMAPRDELSAADVADGIAPPRKKRRPQAAMAQAQMAVMATSAAPPPPPEPPMASMPPPAPMMAKAAAPMAPPRSGGFGGAGAMRNRARPEPEMARRVADDDEAPMEDMELGARFAEGGGPPGAPPLEEPPELPEPALEPMDALLDYDGLVIAGADGRGRLSVEDEVRRDLAVIGLVATTVEVRAQIQVITALVEQHRSDSESAGGGYDWPSSAIPPRTSAGSYDYRYDAESAVDVPSDGAWHSVPVAGTDVALGPRYVAVPAVEPKVYRTVAIANRSPHALLAGPADVSFGDELAMTVQLPTIAPRGEDRAGLGVEESIQVARNTRYKETTGGLLGGASVLQHEVEIELRNNLRRPAPVEVRERIPISTHESIKIEEGAVTPPWRPATEVDLTAKTGGPTALGARVWRVTIPPGDKAKLSAQYSIRIPGDQVLVGGNRRI